METDIQSWVDDILERSKFQWEYRTFRKTEYPEDYNGILEAFPKNSTKFRGGGILLAGNDHYGSQAAAIKLLEHLESGGCEGVFLDGMELSEYGAAEAKVRLNGLLDYFYDEGKSLCLILEGMEECPCRRELLKFLGEQLWESLLYEEQRIPLFLILIDNRESEIPNLLRNRLRLFRTNVPSQTQRTVYLEKHAKYLEGSLSLKQFARLTEGVDYAQLRDMIVLTDRLIDSRYGRALAEEELAEFLAGQMPPEKATQKLCRTVTQLADQLPKILNGISADRLVLQTSPVTASKTSAVDTALQDPTDYLASKQQESEEMPPRDLVIDVMGEIFVNDI